MATQLSSLCSISNCPPSAEMSFSSRSLASSSPLTLMAQPGCPRPAEGSVQGSGALVSLMLGSTLPGFEPGKYWRWPGVCSVWDVSLSPGLVAPSGSSSVPSPAFEPPTLDELAAARPHPHACYCTTTFQWRIVTPWLDPPSRPRRTSAAVTHALAKHFVRFENAVDPRFVLPASGDRLGYPPYSSLPSTSTPSLDYSTDPSTWWDLHVDSYSYLSVVSSPDKAVPSALSPEHLQTLKSDRYDYPPPGSSAIQSVHSAFEYIWRLLHSALVHGNTRAIPIQGSTFPKNLPWNDNTRHLFESLAFRVDDSEQNGLLLIPPKLHQGAPNSAFNRAMMARAMLELGTLVEYFRSQYSNSITSKKANIHMSIRPGRVNFSLYLGGDAFNEDPALASSWRSQCRDDDDDSKPPTSPFFFLGCTPADPLEYVKFAYRSQILTDSKHLPEYLDALQDIADIHRSRGLHSYVEAENNAKKWGRRAITAACAEFGIPTSAGDDDGLDYSMQVPDESILELFSSKFGSIVEENEKDAVIKQLTVLADVRKSDFLWGTIQSVNENIKSQQKQTMTLDRALKVLEIPSTDVDDDFLVSVFISHSQDSSQQKDEMTEALRVIAEEKKSDKLSRFLDTGTTEPEVPPYLTVSADKPVGLENIGNTCYLNSLLQYFFIVRPLRDTIIQSKDAEPSENLLTTDEKSEESQKRVGGRLVSTQEIVRSKRFVRLLGELFYGLIHAPVASIYPEKELAYLALVSSKDEQEEHVNNQKPSADSPSGQVTEHATSMENSESDTHDITSSSPPQGGSGASANHQASDANAENAESDQMTILGKRSPAELGDSSSFHDVTTQWKSHVPQSSSSAEGRRMSVDALQQQPSYWNAPKNNVEQNRSKTLPAWPSSKQPPSPAGDVEMMNGNTPSSSASAVPWEGDSSHVKLPSTAGEEIKDALTRVDWKKDAEKSQDVVEKRSPGSSETPAAHQAQQENFSMMFGKQNDVSECMDNVLFQIEAALDKTNVSKMLGGSGNLVQSLFYGMTRQELDGVIENLSDSQSVKEELFSYLLVAVTKEEGKDLYEGLDETFQEGQVDLDGEKVTRRISITQLPPVLQIQLQRVQFDRDQSRVFKSNAHMPFAERLFMDRYIYHDPSDVSYSQRKTRSREISVQLSDLRLRRNQLRTVEGIPSHLRAMFGYMHDTAMSIPEEDNLCSAEIGEALAAEAQDVEDEMKSIDEGMKKLREERDDLWNDEKGAVFRLVAVFMHRGSATFGHYYVYLRALPKQPDRWIKYSDEQVTEVDSSEVFKDMQGSSDNPYWLSYVREGKQDTVETICREL